MSIKTIAIIAIILLAIQNPPGPTVELSLIVADKNGNRVTTISKDELRVIENKIDQTILSVDADERPLDLGLLIDASGSFRSFIEASLDAARLIITNRRPDDEIFLERFISTDKIQLLQDFTKDSNLLNQRLMTLRIESGRSAVVDALYTGANHLAKHNSSSGSPRRKALVIITDGEDRNSAVKLQDLTKFLREQHIQVFLIGIVSGLDGEGGITRSSPRDKAEKLIKTVAEESGGRAVFPVDKRELLEATAQIIDNLRGQFRITYQSSIDSKEPGFRKVEVKFKSKNDEKRVLIAPRGYYTSAKSIHR